MEKNDKQLELLSEEIREIIGRIPNALIRWGILALSVVLLLLVAGAAWFKYPDRIRSQIVITTTHPPVYLMARTSGRLTELLVQDGDTVSSGQILGVIESAARWKDVLELEKDVDRFTEILFQEDSIERFRFKEYRAGALQSVYARLLKSWRDYRDFVTLDLIGARIRTLNKQLKDYQLLYDRQYRQRQITKEELDLASKQFDRMRSLHDSSALSNAEFEQARSIYLKTKGALESRRVDLSRTLIETDQLKHQILLLEKDRADQRAGYLAAIEGTIEDMKGAISEWKLNYLLTAPMNGVVTFTKVWSVHQFINSGERVMTVLSLEKDEPIGKLLMPLRGSGKVKPGQKVMIRLDKFPYMEYGMLVGVVREISLVSEQEKYSVGVVFPKGLQTTYHKELPFTQGMSGQAEIITQEMSFLVKIVNPVKSLIFRNRPVE